MSIMRWDPFGEMTSLRRAMDRLLEDALVGPGSTTAGGATGGLGVAMDVMDKDDAIVVKASVPGVKPEDINVSVERNVLTISGETREETDGGEGRYYHRERRYGRFSRSVALPQDVNADACEADFEHGVLTITLPKAAQHRVQRIAVRGATNRDQITEGQVTGTSEERTGAQRGAGEGASERNTQGQPSGGQQAGKSGTMTAPQGDQATKQEAESQARAASGRQGGESRS